MALSDQAAQASNVIRQQLDIIFGEMSALEQQNRDVRMANTNFGWENDRLRNAPDVGSRAHYEKRMAEMQNEIYTLREDLKKWKEFGKLKDRAKLKVEQARDAYHTAMTHQQTTIDNLRGRAAKVDELRAQNDRQGVAYQEMRRQNEELNRRNALLVEKVNALQQIIDLGVRGLEVQYQNKLNGDGW
jgi:chromosome segregation ATPase